MSLPVRILKFLAVGGVAAATLSSAGAETLTLEQCLHEVAANNPAIELQRTNIRAAYGTKLVFRSRALPQLSVGLLAGQQGDEGTSIDRAGTAHKVEVAGNRIDRGSRLIAIGTGQFLQPIFDVAIPPAWRRGGIEVAISEQNFYNTASSTLHQARLQYNQALFQREYGRIIHEISGQLDANAKVAGDMYKAGLSSQLASLQAEVQRSGYDVPAFAAQGGYEAAVTQLWQLMGRQSPNAGAKDPLKDLTLSGSLADAHPPEFDSAAVAKAAIEQRPDLCAVRDVIQAYKEDALTVRAGYYPAVQLIITGQALPQNFVRSERPNALRAGDEVSTNEARFGARYQWTLIDTGNVQGQAQNIDHLREGLEANLRHLEQDIPRDLAQLRFLNEKLSHQAETFRGNLSAADDTLKIVSDAVKQGTSSQLEVIDAQNGQLNTQLGMLDVQLQTANAEAEFDRIAGRYVRWVEEPNPGAATRSGRPKTDKD